MKRNSFRLRTIGSAGLAVLLLTLCACSKRDLVKVQILQTTDIHAQITESGQMESGGGWLRIATLIKNKRSEMPDGHTLVIDCGDTVQGTFAAAFSRGQISLDLLEAIGYDVWVPGNHEFDFGVARFMEMCTDQQERLLCGNIQITEPHDDRRFAAWRMFRRGKAEIAVIGMNASHLDQWFWGSETEGLLVEKAAAVLEQILPDIFAQNPDMIVLAIHQGWMIDDPREVNEVTAIAERFPEIDLILGGHTHWEHAGRRVAPHTWYVQAGRHGDALGVIHATIDPERNEVVDLVSWLETPSADIDPDAAAQRAVNPWLDRADSAAAERIAEIPTPVSAAGQPGVNCDLSELISAAIAEGADAPAVIHGKLSRDGIEAGTMTERDLFNIVPYENNIGILHLTGDELIAVIEEQWQNRESYVACGLFGIAAEIGKDGTVIALRSADGAPISGRVKTAFNSYTLAGGGGRFPVLKEIAARPDVQAVDTGLKTRDLVRKFLQQNRQLSKFSARRWLVIGD